MTIVCFGEMLMRFSPAGGASLCDAEDFTVHVAGSEANVAISLASLGTAARMVTVLPDNALGRRALTTLAAHGVDASACLPRPGRMGLFYIEKPGVGREGGYFYDRAGSTFASQASDLDWQTVLQGASWLHISGLTAALGGAAVTALRSAVACAAREGVAISFDCNFRPALWEGRADEARALLWEFAGTAQLLFASDWDARMLLGDRMSDCTAADLLDAMLELRWVASTSRADPDEAPQLGAVLRSRTGTTEIAPAPITCFVDRVGAGDAFAAGLLHGLASGWDDERVLRFAHRACVMKHAIAGDFSTLSVDDICNPDSA